MPEWRDIFAAARTKVMHKQPYFSEALMRMRLVARPGLGTFGVDKGWRIHVDPKTVEEWGVDGSAAAIAHEVEHLLRGHAQRQGGREHHRWNIAGDIAINQNVMDAGWKLPVKSPATPELFKVPRGETSEVYYDLIPPQEGEEGEGQIASGYCGSGAGNPMPWEAGQDENDLPSPASPMEQEIIKRRTAMDVQRYAEKVQRTQQGTLPAGIKQWADLELEPPKVDWRKQLRTIVRHAVASFAGTDQRTWRRLSNRFHSREALDRNTAPTPSHFSPLPKVFVFRDTSGSMSATNKSGRKRSDAASSEILGICRVMGVPVLMADVDAQAAEPRRVRNARHLQEMTGFGGTDMRVGVYAALKHKPDIIIGVTDGETPWPEAHEIPSGIRMVWCVVTDAEVPSYFKHVVRVDDE